MDITKLRENDVRYVTEVVDYLKERQLDVELAGSALNGERTYQDVDLIAKGNLEAIADVTFGLQRFDTKTGPFPEKSTNGLRYRVKHVGGQVIYVGEEVDQRFDIQIEDTKIDLCLKVKK